MQDAVRRRYESLVQSGELTSDPAQRDLADRLDALIDELAGQACRSKKSSLGWLFARGPIRPPPRGFYIWGGVGRGKTFLMDMFFDAAPISARRRVHFHAFMAEVHERITRFRTRLKQGETSGDDPIRPVAAEIAAEARLLCFDEFAVADIADAMILGRLCEALFAAGVTIVATSNVPPDDLYRDGLNRALFLPFIDLLKTHQTVVHLDSARDYRLDDAGVGRRYVTPLGGAARRCLDSHFRRLTGLERGAPRTLALLGRQINVPQAVDGVARFTFEDLCVNPLAAADYLKIAAAFHTIILDDVPQLGPEHRNEARRLINLIDTLYDRHTRLILSAAAEPDELWQGRSGAEAFEFARTASRLFEMRADPWWDGPTEAFESERARAV